MRLSRAGGWGLLLLGVAACRRPAAEAPAVPPVAVTRAGQGAAPPAAPTERSDALKAARPAGGETFGLYLMDKKVGFIVTDLAPVKDHPDQALYTTEFVFQANVGSKLSKRSHREERRYDARPNGKLLGFTIVSSGDGGEERMEATVTAAGMKVRRLRPGQPEQLLERPAPKETIEDADPVRVAVRRGADLSGFVVDAQDLETYPVKTTVGKKQTRTVGGVAVPLTSVVTLSEKEKVPVESFLDDQGRLVEIHFGSTMRAVAEAETVAKRLDQVEVFGLTRVVLPSPPPPSVKSVPGQWTLRVAGLPATFHKDDYRQSFRAEGETVVVTLRAVAPRQSGQRLPVPDPAGGKYLKPSILVESDHPEIQAQAKALVGDEKDAYAVTKRIVRWVNESLTKDYGASADRASDVLRQKRGDCTEHSLLSVALLRAAGVPARRVDGLIYMMNEDKVPALYWHEWVEAFVGEWTQLDPTFGQVVADATHFAVGEEGNAEITPLIGQLKVLEVR